MKPAPFDYVRAASVQEASSLLAQHGEDAKLIAGGQSLVPALNLRLSTPSLLIDIGRIAALRGIARRDGVLHIGAATRHCELLTDPEIVAHAPLLARAAAHIAHPAIRTRGTLGGSLANADPAAELPACMIALDARIVAESTRGERMLRAEAFFTGLFATQLAPDELLTRIEIDIAPTRRCAFHELARRTGDYAIVGLAVCAAAQSLRLAYFAVGATPVLARDAAAAILRGAPIEQAEAALATDLSPHDDLQATAAARMTLARVLLRRATAELRA